MCGHVSLVIESRSSKRVWLSEVAAARIVESARRAHPRETGGVLIGVLSRDQPWVTSAVEIDSDCTDECRYRLPEGARHQAVRELRGEDCRVGYVGDWHSHPGDTGPSATDAHTMIQLARDSAAFCSRPVLIVARRVGTGYELEAWRVRRSKIVRARLIAAGSLPARRDE